MIETEPLAVRRDHPAKTAWMLTFADLLSLMLTFFVMLYAMSTLKTKQWDEVAKSLAEPVPPATVMNQHLGADFGVPKTEMKMALDLDYLAGILDQKLERAPRDLPLVIKRLDDRLVISLASDSLFDSGKANFKPKAAELVGIVTDALGAIANRIEVDGHTDPEPVHSGAYPSNYELSLSRAVTIANRLRRTGYDYPITVFGFGDTRFDEIDPKLPRATRYALARRVDIVVRTTRAK